MSFSNTRRFKHVKSGGRRVRNLHLSFGVLCWIFNAGVFEMSSLDDDLDAQLRQLMYKIEFMVGKVGRYGAYCVDEFRKVDKTNLVPEHIDEIDTIVSGLSEVFPSFDPTYGLVASITSTISDVLYFPKRELHDDLAPEQHARKLGEFIALIKKINKLDKIIKFKLLKITDAAEIFNTKLQTILPNAQEFTYEDLNFQNIESFINQIEQQIAELSAKLQEFQNNFVPSEYTENYAFEFEFGQISVILHELFEAESKGRARSGSPSALYGRIQEYLKTIHEETLEVLAVKKFVGEANKIHLEKTFDDLWNSLSDIRNEIGSAETTYHDKKSIDTTAITKSLTTANDISAEISIQVRDLKKIDLQLRPPLKDINRGSDVDEALKKIDSRLSSVRSANNLIKDNLDDIEKIVQGWVIKYPIPV